MSCLDQAAIQHPGKKQAPNPGRELRSLGAMK